MTRQEFLEQSQHIAISAINRALEHITNNNYGNAEYILRDSRDRINRLKRLIVEIPIAQEQS